MDPHRIAIVDNDKCKPKNCALECKKKCPSNRTGKLCIEVTKASKVASLSETLCIGCGICVKVCPFNAITIINLPKELNTALSVHRYGPNKFQLFRLPTPRLGQVLGLVGINGIGKSTCLKILSGKKPNLGRHDNPPEWLEVLHHFRGSELQNYFTKIVEDQLTCVIKPQYVDLLPRANDGIVSSLLKNIGDKIIKNLELDVIWDRQLSQLSGGELQRFAIAMTCMRPANVYMFDEPSSYLDIKQRIKAAQTIRSITQTPEGTELKQNYVIVVEHDLSLLDYLSDYISVLWGQPGIYGAVTMPFSVREGINIFLDGFVPTENLRFRTEALTFRITDNGDVEDVKKHCLFEYPTLTKTLGQFKLTIEAGEFTDSEIIVLLSQNGCGKSTFLNMLAGRLKSDSGEVPKLNISLKPQMISPKSTTSVRSLLFKNLGTSWQHPQFQSDVFRPMKIEELLDNDVKTLSGGELQRVALVLALGKPADVYLIDEPSAYLDAEQRLVAAKVIKRFIMHSKKTAFVVEHDFIMATYLADRVIVYDGTPSVECRASAPQILVTGMNQFLKQMDITLRRDPTHFRPRINKYQSQMDIQQKQSGNFFHLDI